jgi:hypothetical protein
MTDNQVRPVIAGPRPQEEAMQPSLFDVLAVPAEKLKYEAFKEANPWVIERLTKMCYALYNNGHNHYGIGALVEVLRFQHSTTYDPNSEFKFNNNYRAYLAREIMQNNPMLDGFFSTRKSVADLSEDY